MNKTSGQTIFRYALFQLPHIVVFAVILFLLRFWVSIPLWLVIALIAAWIATGVIIYPFVRRSYSPGVNEGPQDLLGRVGTAKERLNPSGYILLGDQLWRAEIIRGAEPIEEGEKVEVREVRGLILVVGRAGKEK